MTGESGVAGNCPKVPSSPQDEKMTRREHYMALAGCALTGTMTLIPFQFVAVMLPVLSNHFLEGKQLGNSMLGLYQLICVISLLVILKIGALHKWLIQGGLFLSLACMAALPPVFFYGALNCRIAFAHIILGLLGACNGALQSSGFARAAILPRNYVGTTSIGQAVAGLVAFVVTAILMNGVFDMDKEIDVKWFCSICCGISVLLCVLSMMYMHFFLNAKVCVQSVNNALEGKSDAKTVPDDTPTSVVDLEESKVRQSSGPAGSQDESLLPPRPWLTMIKGSWWELLSLFLVFFITFSLFPKVGPVSFNFEGKSPSKMVLLFGMEFVGDFLGRSCLTLPNLHSAFGFLFLPRNGTIIASFLRLIFYVPFLMAMKMENVPFINNFVWLMIIQLLLAFTLGWIGTLTLIHCSLSVTRVSEKARMGSLSTIVLAVAIGIGLYVALAF
ncbi:adenosine transporter, putative [Eimeria necatrix]|uniref:Adenosine transporter, putative n=1 Tax=Eimeria necatrix TaxID=51315 RepID=U6MKU7_9EIME|nr:adenosine transporter, putative [Eimeria necatrix]CDJ64626.1 adenosine transporter, putative [Eimeria necatrix]